MSDMVVRCVDCPNKKSCIVPPRTILNPRLIIVGEGPGRTEEKLGAPFVGMSGKLLDKCLADAGMRRDDCYMTNVALCRGDSDSENEAAADVCTPRLLSELAILPATTSILTLGKSACKAVLGFSNIMVARGFVWVARDVDPKDIRAADRKVEKYAATDKPLPSHLSGLQRKAATLRYRALLAGRSVVPSLHPAFILRADTWHPLLRIDVDRACRLAKGKVTLEDEAPYKVGGPEVLEGFEPVVSLDVETSGISVRECDLLCVGISDGNQTSVLWPWRAAYAHPLTEFLKSRERVVCHNGMFDIAVLRNHGVG